MAVSAGYYYATVGQAAAAGMCAREGCERGLPDHPHTIFCFKRRRELKYCSCACMLKAEAHQLRPPKTGDEEHALWCAEGAEASL